MSEHSEVPSSVEAAEACIDEFIDYFNARDLDGISELFDEDVTSGFLGASGPQGLVQALADMLMQQPALVLTRGELGLEPVAVAWIPNGAEYSRMGFLAFTLNQASDGSAIIEHLEHSQDEEPGLLAEQPDAGEMAEWEDWAEWDEGQESG